MWRSTSRIGLVPFVGDIADIFWKSNSKNMALLEAHVVAGRQASTGDWLFVAGILGAVLALASLPLVLFLWLVNALATSVTAPRVLERKRR